MHSGSRDPRGLASPTCRPHFHVRTAADNHNIPGPPSGKGRGYAFGQSEPASPGCPTYGWPWPCRGRRVGGAASVGGAHVSGPGRRRVAGRLGVPRRGLCSLAAPESRCPVPLLPRPVRVRDTLPPKKKKKTGPQRLTSSE